MKTEEEIKEWKDFRKAVYDSKSKSEDDFEKYITLIASGALALSLTLIDKIVPIKNAIYLWILVIGWGLFSITLFASLLSHFFSRRYSENTINDIDNELEIDTIIENIDIRNSKIEVFNTISISTIFLGISSIILFITINIYNMNNDKNKNPKQQPKPLTEEKGRTIPKPSQQKPNKPLKK